MIALALGDVLQVRSSLVNPTEDRFKHLPHIAPDTIERDTGRLLPYTTVGESGVQSGKYQFEAGDVLYSKIRPNLNKTALVDFGGLCSADMYALQVDPKQMMAPFLHHLLRSPEFVSYATNLSSRANIPKVNRDQLLRFQFKLPSLDEQRRIAAVLDHADALRATRRKSMELFRGLSLAIFIDMFGDPEKSAGRQGVRFGDVADLQGGRNLVAEDEDAISRYRVLKISAVTTGTFEPTESKPLPVDYTPPKSHLVAAGDLLMSRANTADLVGAVAYVDSAPPNLALPDKIWRFSWRDPSSVPLYYWALFRTPAMRRRMSQLSSGTGGSMKNISKAKLEQLELPSVDIAQQHEFERRVAAVPSPTPDEFDELFGALRYRAFSGQL